MQGEPDSSFPAFLSSDPREAEEQYRRLRAKLNFFFEQHGANETENLAQEVIVRALKRIQQGSAITTDLQGYCYGVARNVLREQWKRRPEEALPEIVDPETSVVPGTLTKTESSILVRECLALLPTEERDLFVRYHLEDREDLAAELGASPNALRIRVHRAGKKIADLLRLGQESRP